MAGLKHEVSSMKFYQSLCHSARLKKSFDLIATSFEEHNFQIPQKYIRSYMMHIVVFKARKPMKLSETFKYAASVNESI